MSYYRSHLVFNLLFRADGLNHMGCIQSLLIFFYRALFIAIEMVGLVHVLSEGS